MVFKATAAALALLPMLIGGTYCEPADSAPWASVQLPGAVWRHMPDLRRIDSNLQRTVELGNVVTPAAQRVAPAARPHVPEPKTLMVLGVGLLLFALRCHLRQAYAARQDRASRHDRGQDRTG